MGQLLPFPLLSPTLGTCTMEAPTLDTGMVSPDGPWGGSREAARN